MISIQSRGIQLNLPKKEYLISKIRIKLLKNKVKRKGATRLCNAVSYYVPPPLADETTGSPPAPATASKVEEDEKIDVLINTTTKEPDMELAKFIKGIIRLL